MANGDGAACRRARRCTRNALICYYQVVTGDHKSTIMLYCFPHFVISSCCYRCCTDPVCCYFLIALPFPREFSVQHFASCSVPRTIDFISGSKIDWLHSSFKQFVLCRWHLLGSKRYCPIKHCHAVLAVLSIRKNLSAECLKRMNKLRLAMRTPVTTIAQMLNVNGILAILFERLTRCTPYNMQKFNFSTAINIQNACVLRFSVDPNVNNVLDNWAPS